MAANPSVGTDTFFRWLYTKGYVGKESGLPLEGLGDDSTPEDVVAWALTMDVLFRAGLWLADPEEVARLHARWRAETGRGSK